MARGLSGPQEHETDGTVGPASPEALTDLCCSHFFDVSGLVSLMNTVVSEDVILLIGILYQLALCAQPG